MGRLTKSFDSYCITACEDMPTSNWKEDCRIYEDCYARKIYDKLCHYEDLEEQGRLIELPCKVGDTVYCLDNFQCDGTILNLPRIREVPFNLHLFEFINETVFLTKEEAEAKLEELKGE